MSLHQAGLLPRIHLLVLPAWWSRPCHDDGVQHLHCIDSHLPHVLVPRVPVPLVLLQRGVDLVTLASWILVLCETWYVSPLAWDLMLLLGLPLLLQGE